MSIRGIEFELHPDEAFSNAIRKSKDFYEASVLDYVREHYRIQGTILDIGANIGNHALYFANFLEYKKIVCFEPVDLNFGLLKRNMQTYPNVVCIPCAVSNTAGDVRMSINTGNLGASEVTSDGDYTVKAVAIDDMKFEDVSLIKIDVEWHEPQVLIGAIGTISRWHPLILIEDTRNEYGSLLPGYELEKSFEEHNTYIYRRM